MCFLIGSGLMYTDVSPSRRWKVNCMTCVCVHVPSSCLSTGYTYSLVQNTGIHVMCSNHLPESAVFLCLTFLPYLHPVTVLPRGCLNVKGRELHFSAAEEDENAHKVHSYQRCPLSVYAYMTSHLLLYADYTDACNTCNHLGEAGGGSQLPKTKWSASI